MQLKRYVRSFDAMGGTAELGIIAPHDFAGHVYLDQLQKNVLLFEKRFSRFLPNSEITQLNRRAGQKVAISKEFSELLSVTKQTAQRVDGLFNPFMLPAVQRTGYIGSKIDKYKHQPNLDYTSRIVAPVSSLELGDTWARIPHATALDVGGIGKGYVAEQLALLNHPDIRGYWYNLSGDAAVGGCDEGGHALTLHIQDAANPQTIHSQYRVCVDSAMAGVATSGQLDAQGVRQTRSHLIDPRTLESSRSDINLVTVVADSPAMADVLASVALILGSQEAPAFLSSGEASSWVIQHEGGVNHFGPHILMSVEESVYA